MRLRFLGTGASDGWPNPWCTCASCVAAIAEGVVRGQTSALLDDRLLLDIGPDGPRAAGRFGVSLASVEAVCVSHAHPDHHGVPAWMWRGWVGGRRPLTLVAPAVVDGTRLLAIHLGHDNPPPAELDEVLGGWDAAAPRDGDVVELG